MAIKYLRGIYRRNELRNTRPPGFQFPLGIRIGPNALSNANSSTTTTTNTFDLLMVAGGGGGGWRPPSTAPGAGGGGGGGGGGIRIFSANSFNEIAENNAVLNTDPLAVNFVPVQVGGAGGNSCFGVSFINCGGGDGGGGRTASSYGRAGDGGFGGSGGGGGKSGGLFSPAPNGCGGCGIAGQGCSGFNGHGNGGSATACASTTGGLSSSFTGTSVTYSNGGCNNLSCSGLANRGDGGFGAPTFNFPNNPAQPAGQPGGSGGSGLVAVRYRNPAAPTTPLATGGNCICCTDGCIIHIFTSSGFLNVQSQFNIN
jgi:hypothetical protein